MTIHLKRRILLTGMASASLVGMSRTYAQDSQTNPQKLEALKQRQQLLSKGEAALSSLNTEHAVRSFEMAAHISHEADAEAGLIRSYMQAGNYLQALSFAAHTAGVHLQEAGGAALYTWLLALGGQAVMARQLVNKAIEQSKTTSASHRELLRLVQHQLRGPLPLAERDLLNAPYRMAPYARLADLPSRVRPLASATLINDGRAVLAPAASLANHPGPRWVRHALGEVRRVQRHIIFDSLGLAWLELKEPFPTRNHSSTALLSTQRLFPGSVAYTVQYPPRRSAQAQWPVLNMGFVGSVTKNQNHQLDIPLPQQHRSHDRSHYGGPVYNKAGQLMGVAMMLKGSTQLGLLPMSVVLSSLNANMISKSTRTADHVGDMSVERIYENSLQHTVEILG